MSYLRRHGWWLIPELLVFAILVVGLVFLRPNGLPDQLANRAVAILEQMAPVDLDLYDKVGQGINPDTKIICAAESFGTEPAGAKRIEDVRVFYAHYLCAMVQPGTSWDFASRSTGPAVITLSAPPTVRIVKSGVGYPDRVRELIPDNLEPQAFAGFTDRGRSGDLVTRYNDELT